ncbi:MAG TPA: hypothetical protein VG711_12550 [Phycisphaerales bacterium]|nr:hypothetical protein [Phycisphaerales bacterium]
MTRITTLAFSLLSAGLTISLVLTTPAIAQDTAAVSPDAASYIGVINADDVYIRAGANESYYAFAKASRGALVQVVGEKFDWIRIATVGPAFKNVLGYIKYETSGAPRLRLSADGSSAVTLGRVDIYAPNLDASNNPGESWKPIIRLEAEQPLQVVETITTDRELIHKVILPATASGWIHKKFVDQANSAQLAQWKQSLADMAAMPRPTVSQTAATKPPAKTVETPSQAPTETKQSSETQNDAVVGPQQPAEPSARPQTQGTVPSDLDAQAAPAEEDRAAEEAAEAEKKMQALKLPDLEAALKQVQGEDPATAELDPLRNLYLEFADRHADDAKAARYAKARAEQLGVWMDIQKQRAELAEAQARAQSDTQDVLHARKALDASAEYVVVGRLVASTIYDGARLPKLLRIQDPGTNRTLAYLRLKPDDHDVASMISQIIGVVGDKSFDEVLQLSIVSPRRIDILSPNQDTVTVNASSREQASITP